MPELSPIQSQVLAGLLAGGSIAAVAREHKIHRSTIYNWRHDEPAFIFALNEARIRQKASMYDAIQDLAARAYETLGVLLVSECEQTRIRAAQAILRSVNPAADEPAGFEKSGAALLGAQLQRRSAASTVRPEDRELLQRTLPAVEGHPKAIATASPVQINAPVDTIRQNSTLEKRSSVEPAKALEAAT